MTAPRTPFIVNVGMGVDSVAMLVGLQQRGERPDVVIFADVGAEKPETYAYVPVLRAWLARVGFPDLTVVRRPVGPSGDDSLETSCLRLETLPSASFRGKSCSLKWKAEAMDKFLLGVSKGPNKRPGLALVVDAVRAGIKPVKAIGYDAGPKDSKRTGKSEDDVWAYRYPLREWGWSRERCIEEIAAAGLPVPVKSACFFCANSKPWELRWLAAKHPDLFARALRVEDTARNGQHGLDKVKGLWGHAAPKGQAGGGSWRAWAEAEGIVAPGGYDVICDRTALMARALAEKPSIESNDDRPCARDDADEAPAQLVQLGRRVKAAPAPEAPVAPAPAPVAVVEAPAAPVAVAAPAPKAPVVAAPVAAVTPAPGALVAACRAYFDGLPVDDVDFDPDVCVDAVALAFPGVARALVHAAAQRAFDDALEELVAA